jgi:hypothetical protein
MNFLIPVFLDERGKLDNKTWLSWLRAKLWRIR